MSQSTRRCTAQYASGDFCDNVSSMDMPFPICGRHALKVYQRVSELTDNQRAAMAPSVRVVLTGPSQTRDRNEALAAICAGRSTIYAARCPDGIIKIGYSTNLAQRISQLVPKVDLIGFQFGDYFAEQAIHAGLVAHRARGREWYHPVPEVLSVVNGMRADLGLPDIAA